MYTHSLRATRHKEVFDLVVSTADKQAAKFARARADLRHQEGVIQRQRRRIEQERDAARRRIARAERHTRKVMTAWELDRAALQRCVVCAV